MATVHVKSPAADIVRNYESGDSTPLSSPEQEKPFIVARSDPPAPPLQTFRSDSRDSAGCYDSTSNLVALENGTGPRHIEEARASPFLWNFPSLSQLPPLDDGPQNNSVDTGNEKKPTNIWEGWRIIVFGSWFNLLLVFIPVSWILDVALKNSDTVVFIFCILSMIPLVRLHDLATRELALRIGGSKTGLLNASMSNTVELVVAIIALRKCELRIVQSSLIGSILSKLLLVLGMCFFAGGIRFEEQDFDSTATQIHSSLLSISVGALLLPAAYHFALSGSKDSGSTEQKKDILRMSYGVSIVLLFIYAAYLLFQLWSHTYLYKDTKKNSNRLSVRIPYEPRFRSEKRYPTEDGETDSMGFKWTRSSSRLSTLSSKLPSLNRLSYGTSPFASTSEVTLENQETYSASNSAVPAPPVNSTVRLIQAIRNRREGTMSSVSAESTSKLSVRSATLVFQDETAENVPYQEGAQPSDPDPDTRSFKEPRLSWFMTLLLLTAVTVMVAITAEWLVESMDVISVAIDKQWIGLILLPAVSSIAECVTSVNVSVKDQLSLSVSVAVGSTIQTTLFVIPFIVLLGWMINKPVALLFDPFESVVLYISVQTMSYVVADGKSNWLEGVILLCLYIIIAVSFWFYPGMNLPSQLASCSATP